MPKARILVVEDESIIAMDIQSRLRRLNYTVPEHVGTGEEAVKRAGEAHPDLVLMDIKLAGEMDGIQAAEVIRAEYSIPVVYLTAFADEELLQRAKVTEPYGYILKPLQERELHATIEMALYKHRTEQELRENYKQLEQRLHELSGMNAMFQRQIEENAEASEHLRRCRALLRETARRLKGLAAELEQQIPKELS